MEDEIKAVLFLVLLLAVFVFSWLSWDYIQTRHMADKGLCWNIVQLQNKEPQHQWSKCQ